MFVGLAGPRRRSGAVLVEDDDDHLLGIFTDSDLARLFERRREAGPRPADRRGDDPRTRSESRVGADARRRGRAHETHKISELPVVDRGGHLVGLIDVTDLIGLVPAEFEE